MTKIKDLQEQTEKRVRNYIEEMNKQRVIKNSEPTSDNDRCSYSVNFEFGTKHTSLSIRNGYYSRYSQNKTGSLTISTSLEEKGESHLLVYLSVSITNGIPDMTHEERRDVIVAYLKYWVSYKENKKIKRLFFKFFDKDENEIFNEALEEMNYVNIGCTDIISQESNYSYSTKSVYRENIKDEEVEKAIFIQKQIDEEMKKNPTFEAQKKGSGFGKEKIANHTFYYLDTTFQIKPRDEEVILELNGEIISYEYSEGLVESILSLINRQMKLSNLIKPPIKNMKLFFENSCKLKLPDSELEDKVRELNEELGDNIAESEAVYLNKKILDVRTFDNSLEKIVNFKSNDDQKYFTEYFGTEFILSKIETNEYNWYILVQRRNYEYDNMYLFPTKNDELPEGARQKAHEIVNARRDSELMNEFEELIGKVNQLNEKCKGLRVSTKVKAAIKELNNGASEEFGKKWLEEK